MNRRDGAGEEGAENIKSWAGSLYQTKEKDVNTQRDVIKENGNSWEDPGPKNDLNQGKCGGAGK